MIKLLVPIALAFLLQAAWPARAQFSEQPRYQNGITPLPQVTSGDMPSLPSASAAPSASMAFQATDGPPPATSLPELRKIVTQPPDATRPVESTWYTRLDYFNWYERVGGANFMKENGLLPALGYMRRSGPARFRLELFGNKVNYSADIHFNNGDVLPLSSVTNYLGLRGECEFMYEPERWPRASFFGGLGSRFWIRNLPDSQIDPQHFVIGYQETWWTFYPYVGLETRRTVSDDWEFYWRGRVGLIAFTYEHVTVDDLILYPRQGFTAQAEAGFRGEHLFIGANFEAMQWAPSAVVRDSLQPRSQMYLVGLKTGFGY